MLNVLAIDDHIFCMLKDIYIIFILDCCRMLTIHFRRQAYLSCLFYAIRVNDFRFFNLLFYLKLTPVQRTCSRWIIKVAVVRMESTFTSEGRRRVEDKARMEKLQKLYGLEPYDYLIVVKVLVLLKIFQNSPMRLER